MNIVICARSICKNSVATDNRVLIELLGQISNQNDNHRFLLISDKTGITGLPHHSNIEIITISYPVKNPVLKKLWWNIKLHTALKKLHADVLISFDGQISKSLSLPQILVIAENEKIKAGYLNKARRIAVISYGYKKKLVQQHNLDEGKVDVIFTAVSELYLPVNDNLKEVIKQKYTEGKEYFLVPDMPRGTENLISLLKSFSQFKKRQQSSMKLVLMAIPGKTFYKKLSSYKYREDVIIPGKLQPADEVALIAASYAVLIFPGNKQPVASLLKAMQSRSPVIIYKDPEAEEIAGKSGLYMENEKDAGEKMIKLYTDENLRNQLMDDGEKIIKNYTTSKMAEALWQSIADAVK